MEKFTLSDNDNYLEDFAIIDLYKRFVIGSESKFRFLTSLYDTDALNAVIRLFVVRGLQFELMV